MVLDLKGVFFFSVSHLHLRLNGETLSQGSAASCPGLDYPQEFKNSPTL